MELTIPLQLDRKSHPETSFFVFTSPCSALETFSQSIAENVSAEAPRRLAGASLAFSLHDITQPSNAIAGTSLPLLGLLYTAVLMRRLRALPSHASSEKYTPRVACSLQL